MASKKKLVELFQSRGLLFPETAKEVEEFEKLNSAEAIIPRDWNDPEAILRRGFQRLDSIKKVSQGDLKIDFEELRMVARKGNALPPHIIDKMKANHKKDDK